MLGSPQESNPDAETLAFDELYIDYTDAPELTTYITRDGKPLAYRHYPSQSDLVIILLHGTGWHSQYLFPLAKFISTEGLAQVFTPDLRGHGLQPEKRGDLDYIDQMEDDVADLIALIRKDDPDQKIFVGGHSSGGGLAVRLAGSRYAQQVDGYILISPYLQYNAPTTRPNSGVWAIPNTGRFAGLTMLNNVGLHWFDHLNVLEFNMPEEARSGTETLHYSYRLNTAYHPRNYKKDLAAITQPLLVISGSADEINFPEQYEPVISQYTRADVEIIPDLTHMGVVVRPEIQPIIKEWLQDLNTP